MEKKFNEIVLALIGMGYYFNREWTLETANHKLENKRDEKRSVWVLYIDGGVWDWPESVLDGVLAELK